MAFGRQLRPIDTNLRQGEAANFPHRAMLSAGGVPDMSEAYFLERVAEAKKQADAATLANVRDRCLRSAAAWMEMATRAGQTAAFKKINEKSRQRSC
jgi:hypothetical protein